MSGDDELIEAIAESSEGMEASRKRREGYEKTHIFLVNSGRDEDNTSFHYLSKAAEDFYQHEQSNLARKHLASMESIEEHHPSFFQQLEAFQELAVLTALIMPLVAGLMDASIVLIIRENQPGKDRMQVMIFMLQVRLAEAIENRGLRTRSVWLQLLLYHNALLARLLSMYGRGRREAARETWQYQIRMTDGSKKTCTELRDHFLEMDESDTDRAFNSLYAEYKRLALA